MPENTKGVGVLKRLLDINALSNNLSPQIYFAIRTVFLPTSIFCLSMWVIFGYDSTVGYTQGVLMDLLGLPRGEGLEMSYGMGIHWSTLFMLSLVMYALMLNFQRGDLSLRSFYDEFRKDVRRFHVFSKDKIKKEHDTFVVDGMRASCFCLLVCIGIVFFYEVPWVFAYNYFHFGDLFFPVYKGVLIYGENEMMIGDLNVYFYRNTVFTAYLLVLPILMMVQASEKVQGKRKRLYRMTIRNKRNIGVLFVIALSVWLFWFYYPLPHEQPYSVHFPQTCYTEYYNVTKGDFYTKEQLGGFYVNDDAVHTVNVISKLTMFALLGYLYMPKVKRLKG